MGRDDSHHEPADGNEANGAGHQLADETDETVRFAFITLSGRLLSHARQQVLRVSQAFAELLTARRSNLDILLEAPASREAHQ